MSLIENTASRQPEPDLPLHVLLIEDDVDIADSLASWLPAEGYTVDVARSGAIAVKRAREQRPDVILLDVMLPHHDGPAVAEILRGSDLDLQSTPIIVFSGGRRLEEAARAIGTPYYLRKPFDLEDILALTRRALDESAAGQARRVRSASIG